MDPVIRKVPNFIHILLLRHPTVVRLTHLFLALP